MNKVIWKFPLEGLPKETIKMPVGAQILSLQTQYSNGTIWAMVDEDAKYYEERTFLTVGTGDEFDYTNKRYIGTYQMNDGRYVLHVLEIL